MSDTDEGFEEDVYPTFVCHVCRRSFRGAIGSMCGECHKTGRAAIALGHAIARFLRRAEVEGLVEEINDARADMVSATISDCHPLSDHGQAERDYVAAKDRHCTALTRLAALALDGGGR